MNNRAIPAPDWLTRSAVYQINPRTFCAEGTIAAVTRELPKLAELGFGVMYLCPVFEEDDSDDRAYWSERQKKSETHNPKNPYRIKNYYAIDPEYGTMDDLRDFVRESHRLGMRVLLDLVYLHIAPNADILKIHPDFAQQDADGNTICTQWHFPYLDFAHPGLREYLWCNMTYYVGALDVDGFRCDVGDGVPIDFWAEGRRRIQAIKPDAVLINEGSEPQSLRLAFDSMYCFGWHEMAYAVYAAKSKPASELRAFWEETHEKLPAGAQLLRDIDNHDTVTDWPMRTERAIGHDGMEQLEVMTYLIDGVPMVYCGNELGDTAPLSMFANRFHSGRFRPTDRSIAVEDYSQRRQSVIRQMNALKRQSDVLRWGRTQWIDHELPETVVAFRREWKGESIIFIGNAAVQPCEITLDENGSVLMCNGSNLENGSLHLASYGYIVLSNHCEEEFQ